MTGAAGDTGLTARQVADADEAEALFRFRYEIYVEEFGMTGEADHDARLLRDAYDDHADNFALFEDDRIVGSLRILRLNEVPDKSQIAANFEIRPALQAFGAGAIVISSRFLVAPELRQGQAIFRLMQHAFLEALGKGVRLNYGDSSPHLLPLYEQMGYRRYTSGYNDSANGFKLPVLMLLRDRDYLGRCRSPFRQLVDESADDAEARSWFAANYPLYVTPPTASFMEDDTFLEFVADRVAGDPAHHMSLLRGLEPAEQQKFLNSATTVRVNPNDRIIRKGDRDATVYAILSGIAEVANPDGGPPLAVFGSGDTVGEIGFLGDVPRTADVYARTHGEVLVLTSDFLDGFLRQEPVIAAKVLRNLSRELAIRLAESNERQRAD